MERIENLSPGCVGFFVDGRPIITNATQTELLRKLAAGGCYVRGARVASARKLEALGLATLEDHGVGPKGIDGRSDGERWIAALTELGRSFAAAATAPQGQLLPVTSDLRRTADGSYEALHDGDAWKLRRTPKSAGVPEGDDLGSFPTLRATERALKVAQRVYTEPRDDAFTALELALLADALDSHILRLRTGTSEGRDEEIEQAAALAERLDAKAAGVSEPRSQRRQDTVKGAA